jgi:Domain of unknown function (DUF5668)
MRFSAGRIVLGLGLVALGILFLLDQAGTIDAGEIIGDWWPVVIIAIGAVQLVQQPRSPVGPLIVVGIGIVFLLAQLDVLGDDVWRFVWPVALVIVGLVFLLRRPGRSAANDRPEDVVGTTAFFSGTEIVISSQRFAGGSATRSSGRGARSPEGPARPRRGHAGGDHRVRRCRRHRSQGWRVETRGTPILGGVDNKIDAPPDGHGPVLTIDLTVLSGGAEIKHDK